jgi:hypothetical protein
VGFATDKVLFGYLPEYERIAAELGPAASVLELGVAEGESLRLWQHLFPDGQITGVDCADGSTWPEGTVKVLASHDSPALPGLLDGPYGLIVDDGCHVGPVVRRSFDLLWPVVRPGGYYVVEDWQVSLRDADSPGEKWGARWGPDMLRAAESFLPLLERRGGGCDSITYRYGMVIIHKNRNPG